MENFLSRKISEPTTRNNLISHSPPFFFFGNTVETKVWYTGSRTIRGLCIDKSLKGLNCQSLHGEKEWTLWILAVNSPFSHSDEHSFRGVSTVLGLFVIAPHLSQVDESGRSSKLSVFSTYIASPEMSSHLRRWVHQHSRYETGQGMRHCKEVNFLDSL